LQATSSKKYTLRRCALVERRSSSRRRHRSRRRSTRDVHAVTPPRWVTASVQCFRALLTLTSTKNDGARVSTQLCTAVTPATCSAAQWNRQSRAKYPVRQLRVLPLREYLYDRGHSLSTLCPGASSRRESASRVVADSLECKHQPGRSCRHPERWRSYQKLRLTSRMLPSR